MPPSNCTARRFFVRRWISDALVRRIECVPYALASSPIYLTHESSMRAYWRVPMLPYIRLKRWGAIAW